jgi:hypothetical protein
MTQRQIAEAISGGSFELAYPHLAENIIWSVIGEFQLKGKKNVIEKFEQTSDYFKSVKTDFKTLNVIADKDYVVINGTAEFIRDGRRVAFVSACDVYEFTGSSTLKKITSYCIQDKKK